MLEELIEFTPVLKCGKGLPRQVKCSVRPLCPRARHFLLSRFPDRRAGAPLLCPEVPESLWAMHQSDYTKSVLVYFVSKSDCPGYFASCFTQRSQPECPEALCEERGGGRCPPTPSLTAAADGPGLPGGLPAAAPRLPAGRRREAASGLRFASLCFVLLRFASPGCGTGGGRGGCAPASCPRRVQVRGCPGKAQTDPHQKSPEFAWQSCSNTFTEGFVYSQGLIAFQAFCLHKLLLTEAICFCL